MTDKLLDNLPEPLARYIRDVARDSEESVHDALCDIIMAHRHQRMSTTEHRTRPANRHKKRKE